MCFDLLLLAAILQRLEKVENLKHEVLKLDQRTIAEIKSFSAPPAAMITVMRAVLLLLGSDKQAMNVS